jgi:hypothetical protein
VPTTPRVLPCRSQLVGLGDAGELEVAGGDGEEDRGQEARSERGLLLGGVAGIDLFRAPVGLARDDLHEQPASPGLYLDDL